MMNMAVAPVSVMACEGAAIVIALIESILGLTYSWLVVAIVCGRGLYTRLPELVFDVTTVTTSSSSTSDTRLILQLRQRPRPNPPL